METTIKRSQCINPCIFCNPQICTTTRKNIQIPSLLCTPLRVQFSRIKKKFFSLKKLEKKKFTLEKGTSAREARACWHNGASLEHLNIIMPWCFTSFKRPPMMPRGVSLPQGCIVVVNLFWAYLIEFILSKQFFNYCFVTFSQANKCTGDTHCILDTITNDNIFLAYSY